jgi:5'-methylthioadenosine phosphorylase
MDEARADVAVVGGSGLYSLLDDDAITVKVQTPYGDPSSPVTIADVAGVRVAFLARHGLHHELPPHQVPYRANAWALHSLGVRRVLAPCAVGSLRADVGPGSLVVPDQVVDWTRGRIQTFHDRYTDGPVHAEFADPYCAQGRRAALDAAAAQGWAAVDGGAMVVVDGPRFSTRAESQFFAGQGWLLVNMTGHPEAVLARELGLCYSAVALVTDLDAGVAAGEGVSVAEVMTQFAQNTDRLRRVLLDAVTRLPTDTCPNCPAPASL